MTLINVDHINPFLMASSKILKQMCTVDVKLGKPHIKEPIFLDNTLIIIIGFTGERKGQVMIVLNEPVALDLASRMIMMPITEMDDISKSAIAELGNMIMGNAATIFSNKGIAIDITPPTLGLGTMSFSTKYAQNISIPMTYEDNKVIEVNVAIKE